MSRTMTTTPPTTENVSHRYRPGYIHIGIDESGSSHCYDTAWEHVHVIQPDGTREARIDLLTSDDVACVEDYIAKVDRDWETVEFGFEAFLDQLAEAI